MKTWKIMVGFLTGYGRSASWFTVTSIQTRVSLAQAIYEARKLGYKRSDDICGDMIFWARDIENGGYATIVEQAQAEFLAVKILAEES